MFRLRMIALVVALLLPASLAPAQTVLPNRYVGTFVTVDGAPAAPTGLRFVVAAEGPELEAKHSAMIEAYAARFGMPALTKEAGQQWTRQLCEQFRFSFPNEGWGWKRASPTRPESNESIARQFNGRIFAYDLIIGAGGVGQRLEPRARAEDISDQVFIEVAAVNHLGTSPDPSPGPGPVTPSPVGDVSAIVAELNEGQILQQQTIAALAELLTALARVHATLEDVKAHDLVVANELRISRAELAAAIERVRAQVAGGIRVRF